MVSWLAPEGSFARVRLHWPEPPTTVVPTTVLPFMTTMLVPGRAVPLRFQVLVVRFGVAVTPPLVRLPLSKVAVVPSSDDVVLPRRPRSPPPDDDVALMLTLNPADIALVLPA